MSQLTERDPAWERLVALVAASDDPEVRALVARLEAEREALRREREAVTAEREAVAAERAAAAAEREAVAAEREAVAAEREAWLAEQAEGAAERDRATKDRARMAREGEQLQEGVRKAREDLRLAQARIKQGPADARALKDVERKIAEVARQVAVGGALEPRKGDEPDRADVRSVTVGMKVFVPRLRTEAEVVEVLGGGQVRVAAGPLKLLTSVDELKQAKVAPATKGSGSAKAAHKKPHPLSFDAAADPDVPMQTSDNTVDLRGMRAHEAVSAAEQFLDRCLNRGLRVAFLIHGHGTGALRKEVRDAVRASSYVERSRPGEPREGGDGVTVVWLR